MKRINILLCLVLSALMAWASQEVGDSLTDRAVDLPDVEPSCLLEPNRPPAIMFTAEGGWGRVLDSYLTPITYKGWHTALGFEHNQACGFSPERWQRQLSLGVAYDHVDNRVGNNTMHHLGGTARWALMRRWSGVFNRHLSLMGGGMTWLHGGIIYNSANSNNPVSVKAHWTLGLQGIAQYDTHLGHVPVCLRYQAALPVAGVWFSPDYDESFYEIYVGNRKHLVQPGWWGNRFDLDHQVTADFRLGGTILRVGYHGTIERSWARHLNTHITTHGIVLGIGGEFLSLPSRSSRVISTY